MNETPSQDLTAAERDMLEVSTALYGWAPQAEAFEATTKAVEQIVAAREEAALRAHADAVGETLKAELLIELDRQITDYEAKALPALAKRIRENADSFAQFAVDKRAAVLLVALLIEHAGNDVVASTEERSDG